MENQKPFNYKKSKKIILGALVFLGIYATAQMVVQDPANLAIQAENQTKLIQQIQIAQEQADKMRSMKEQIEKNMRYVEEVNNQIRNVSKIKQIAKNQASVFNKCYQIKNSFKNSKNLEVVLQAEQTTNSVLSVTQSNIQELSKIISNGFFNMTDGDRLEQINNYEKATFNTIESLNELQVLLKNYDEARSIYTMK